MGAAPKNVRPCTFLGFEFRLTPKLASDSHHGHPCPYRNEVEEWIESETADVATRTE